MTLSPFRLTDGTWRRRLRRFWTRIQRTGDRERAVVAENIPLVAMIFLLAVTNGKMSPRKIKRLVNLRCFRMTIDWPFSHSLSASDRPKSGQGRENPLFV